MRFVAMKRRSCLGIASAAFVCCAVGGEVLYNGIVLPDNWPPRIDAMFPGPTTPPYLKNPPSAIRIDVGRQLFVDDFLVASSEGVVRKFYKPVKFEGNPVLWPETDEELARWTELGDRPYPPGATTAQKWNPMYKSVPACCLSGGYLAAGGPGYMGFRDE